MNWIQYLRAVTGSDRAVSIIQEFMGYVFWPDNRYGKFLAVSGSMAETYIFMRIARKAAGAAVAIAGECLDDALCRTALGRARLAVSTDFADIVLSQWLMPFLDGEYLPGETDDGLPVLIEHHAKLILFARKPTAFDTLPPKIRDRMLHVPFHRAAVQFDTRTVDRLLSELPDIRRWASEGLDRLTAVGEFGRAFCAAA